MYYILNETDQIIAADHELLTHCNVTDVSGLSSKITVDDSGSIEEHITITSEGSKHKFPIIKTSLSGTMGNLTLVALGEGQEVEEEIQPLVLDDEISFDIPTDDTDSDLFEVKESVEEETPSKTEEIVLDDTFDLLGEGTATTDLDTVPADKEESIDLELDVAPEEKAESIDLDLDILSEEKEEEISLDLETPSEDTTGDIDLGLDTVSESITEETGEIIVDIANISQDMGISDEDYEAFLNEYIDTALALEEDLQSQDASVRNGAIATLTDMSEIMRLTEISDIMKKINESSPEQQKGYMGSLYTTLSRLTTQSSSNETVEMDIFDTEEEIPTKIETEEMAIEEAAPEEIAAEPNPNGFGTIDLSDVKPKHFDFQLEEAANDLSLPVELIEEFVHDFIEQAHVETKKMLTAYEEGDLSKIQAIGHLLKGASSNLRINALSDTLYKIQFCENENGLDDLIRDYWAHFLSFENQINVISK